MFFTKWGPSFLRAPPCLYKCMASPHSHQAQTDWCRSGGCRDAGSPQMEHLVGGEMRWPHFLSSSEPLCRFPLQQWAKELCPPSCITVSKFNDWHLWGARRSWSEAYRAHVRKYRSSILSIKKCVRFAKGNIGWRQSWEKQIFEKSQDSTEGRCK